MNKIFLLILILIIPLWSQTRKMETDTLKARVGLKMKYTGIWYDRTSFFNNLNNNNQITTSIIADSNVSKVKLSTAVHQWVETAGGGTIYNNPDDITIMANPDSTLSVKPLGLDSSRYANSSIGYYKLSNSLQDSLQGIITEYFYPAYPNSYDGYLENASLDSFTVTDSIQMSGGSRWGSFRRIESTNIGDQNLQIYHCFIHWYPSASFRSWMWGSEPSIVITLEYRSNETSASYANVSLDIYTSLGSNVYSGTNQVASVADTWYTINLNTSSVSSTDFPWIFDIEVEVSYSDQNNYLDIGYLKVKYKGK